jgi:hypothetical protein
MAAAVSVTFTDACDVFLCHVEGQNNTFMDCLRRILLCVGRTKGKQNHFLKVFLEPRSLTTCASSTPLPVMENEAETCHTGGHNRRQSICFFMAGTQICLNCRCITFKPL